ncbi:hypothetical protein [Rickettsia australis]|uniref:Antitoxin of toxin-antitoxin system StbD n=1 Tax=Rickettsia australis (strain Cutlack) TaxID=1105110 RepID=H8K8V9_RICAC|nr:hypothetical protein [Rickettsia australis]AFC70479.1 antitoxin of toxin-antitoxin system StbD [Rickettsia australis str. Cutlack]
MTQAVKSPVIINKYGKLLISPEEYEKFNQLEDMYWKMQAKNESKSGFLLEKESKDFLNNILDCVK